MKVCIIGNSQVACLKAAWDATRGDTPGVEMTFFATFGESHKHLEIEGRRLVPRSAVVRDQILYTAGRDEIVASDYDVFLVCGCGTDLLPVDARVSSNVLRTTVRDILTTSLAYRLAAMLRSISDAPIYIIASPLKDERTAPSAPAEYVPYTAVFPLLTEALDIAGTRLLAQPEQTITGGHFTKFEYSKDAVHLATREGLEGKLYRDDETGHMNTAYGIIRLRDFFDAVSASARPGI